ncbi:lipoate--protein ligase family protein [Coraliomargarita sp. W4R53]
MLIALPNAFGDAVTNMAIDAALLESMPSGLAAFRHYAWLEPAVTFGYAQSYTEIEQSTDSPITLVRRLTGGGIVDHRNDWTYALILQRALPCTTIPATELYLRIHRAISLALKEMDIETQLAPCPRHCNQAPIPATAPSQCFVTPAANDVLHLEGQKIAGAAMKRTRQGLLIQGSIDRGALPESFDFANFQKRLITQLSSTLELPLGELEDIRPLFNSERIEREKIRFAGEAWNKKR